MPPSPDQPADQQVHVLAAGLGALCDRMGIELVEARGDRVVGTMPVAGNTQPAGLLHGGASVVLAESLGSIGAWLDAYPERTPVGVEINATHHRAARSGAVTGVATPLHLGKTVSTWNVSIRDRQNRLVCTARITCLLIPTPGIP
ncbi:MAG: PaaI family thioesterase [Nocardioides sp.]